MEYIVAGATFAWTPQASVRDNFASTAGVPVGWQTTLGAVSVAPASSAVNSQGIAQTVATAGPLAAGAEATLTGCAWTNVCASFTTVGVDLADLRVIAVSGANQIVAANGTIGPVVVQVMDTASHPVGGAVVQIFETVDAWQPACPDRGRCPVAPELAASQSSAVSDANGLLTIVPQQLPGISETTNLAAAVGTQGFLSLALQKHP
jgi:hypothetical protein